MIARRLGTTVADLRRDNQLTSDTIHPGQRLRIQQPLRKIRASDIRWRCPLAKPGRLLRNFGSYKNGPRVTIPHHGIDIGTEGGASVVSPATGVVRYVGLQEGFGLVVIISHGATYSSVMSPLDPDHVLCSEGEAVLGGTTLGHLGQPVEHEIPYLHVELRRKNKAINPGRLRR